MDSDLAFGPIDFEAMEHRKIGANVRGVGIEERAIPVKEHSARGELEQFQGEEIVPERSAMH